MKSKGRPAHCKVIIDDGTVDVVAYEMSVEISNYPTKFRLRGGCAEFDEENFLLDEDYLMVSETLFQGFKQTRIFFNRKLILVHSFFSFSQIQELLQHKDCRYYSSRYLLLTLQQYCEKMGAVQ